MGLDMYAYRRTHTTRWEGTPESERYEVTITRGGEPVTGIDPARICQIDEEVMYWRKANHIHRWFVENVQGGTDNCATYYLSIKNVRKLALVCNLVLETSTLSRKGKGPLVNILDAETGKQYRRRPKVIEDPTVAQEHLPTQSGFFFGSTEYDEYYLESVRATRDWAERMIADHESGLTADLYYSSSW